MRFLVDECCEPNLVAALRAAGHDVHYIVEIERGADDALILKLAFAERRIVVTDDKDFAALAVRSPSSSAGLILIRIDPSLADTRRRALLAATERFGERLHDQITVIFPGAVRIRLSVCDRNDWRMVPRAPLQIRDQSCDI